jgi:hypothetical protein
VYTGAGPAPDDGMYLVDTSCLPDADACARQRRGPFKHNRLWMQGLVAHAPALRGV